MNKFSSIMFVGTGSDVGKSIIATGICRILKQDGYRPAPFKAQNMSLNSYATPDGFEIGRAQAVQAEACGIDCSTDMNPVLLKPTSEKSSQIVLNGKPIGNQSARDYFNGKNREDLFDQVKLAFDRLQKKHNPIVLEGAGSISELNLKQRDIVNMRMAKYANACVYLIADIDKGGVFASVHGTIDLLEDWERKLIKGIIINKFRGDINLFKDGKSKIEELTGIPVIGIVPYASDIFIEEEDSVALNQKKILAVNDKINVSVVLLPHLSNYTDFGLLEKDERVNLYYSNQEKEIEKADIIILPGTKNTISDMQYLRKNGFENILLNALKKGKKVIGICGGYQMLGHTIEDPLEIEGSLKQILGFGLLPVKTVLTREKTTVQRQFTYRDNSTICSGYEIHMGQTSCEIPSPLIKYNDIEEGYLLNDQCWGTYMHGILDNPVVIDDLLGDVSLHEKKSYADFKEENYDKLATHLRRYLDIEKIYQDLNLG